MSKPTDLDDVLFDLLADKETKSLSVTKFWNVSNCVHAIYTLVQLDENEPVFFLVFKVTSKAVISWCLLLHNKTTQFTNL